MTTQIDFLRRSKIAAPMVARRLSAFQPHLNRWTSSSQPLQRCPREEVAKMDRTTHPVAFPDERCLHSLQLGIPPSFSDPREACSHQLLLSLLPGPDRTHLSETSTFFPSCSKTHVSDRRLQFRQGNVPEHRTFRSRHWRHLLMQDECGSFKGRPMRLLTLDSFVSPSMTTSWHSAFRSWCRSSLISRESSNEGVMIEERLEWISFSPESDAPVDFQGGYSTRKRQTRSSVSSAPT
jgi:hypothetical protein